MTTESISLTELGPQHLADALQLSRAAAWPHRLEDWQMGLALGQGFAAIGKDGVLYGTALLTPFGREAATVNMVIVAETARGSGLGRRLTEAALRAADMRPLRLIATREGRPLYEKLGFRATGTIVQHQGTVDDIAPPVGVAAMAPGDIPEVVALDHAAYGADREGLIAYIANVGSIAVLRQGDRVSGFAAVRAFGRGEVIGPVVASDAVAAKTLVAHFLSQRRGAFVRLDTDVDSGLGDWLSAQGLAHVGGGIAMQCPVVPSRPTDVKTFALASQAFG